MKRLFENLRNGSLRFMQGRYGFDELSRLLTIAALLLLLLSCLIPKSGILYFAALLLLGWSWFRSLSKNIGKRSLERNRYLTLRGKVLQKFGLAKSKWRDRKTHLYLSCPSCKTTVRIPKPEGHKSISITCPKCKNSFSRRT